MKATLAVAFIAILCLSMFSVYAPKVIAQQSSADWPMFHADPSHSGAGTGNPVLTPTLLWNYTTGGGIGSSPAVVGGVVYIGSYDGKVYALNANNGIQLWNYTAGATVESSPAVVNGVVYIGSEVSTVLNGNYFGSVYALNATNGNKLWNYTTGNYYNYVESSPAVVGGVVYIGSSEGITPEPPTFASAGNVYALNATNGDKLWNYTTGSNVDSSPAVVDGVVYVGSGNGNVYALNASSGAKLWIYTTNGWVDSSPAVVDGVVYVGSFDSNVYALNASSGAKLWIYTTGAPVFSSPAVVNGVVYIGSLNGNVYALNATNSHKLWNYTTGGTLVVSCCCRRRSLRRLRRQLLCFERF